MKAKEILIFKNQDGVEKKIVLYSSAARLLKKMDMGRSEFMGMLRIYLSVSGFDGALVSVNGPIIEIGMLKKEKLREGRN